MDFRVLGPLEILGESENIVPTAPKPRQVIALLVLRWNRMVQMSELIDELWGDDPPATATTTVQTYVYKLRKVFVAHGGQDILSTRPSGYSVTLPDGAVDLHRFERDAARGKALLERGDAAGAAPLLKRALDMWRGPALVDVVPGRLLSSYVTWLEEQRLRALALRIDADLALGRHYELISELKSLVLIHTLDERLHGSLMLALYRSGRRHEALDVFQLLRHNMIEDLGMEPGGELAALHQSLLNDQPPGPAAGPPRPVALSRGTAAPTAAGPTGGDPAVRDPVGPDSAGPDSAGPGPAVRPAPPSGPPPAHAATAAPPPGEPASPAAASPAPASPVPASPALPRPPAQLPPDLPDFTGRAALLDQLLSRHATTDHQAARTAPPIVVLAGMPGIGKTALAIHLAHKLAPLFPDGQLYADLRNSTDAPRDTGRVLDGFLRALGVTEREIPDGLEERSTLFRTVTAGRRLLLVLDDASLAHAGPLLPGEPQCAALVTSRRRLHGLEGACTVDVGALSPAEGTELLARVAGGARVDRERAAAGRLVELAGRGHPLALRCVGSRLNAMPDLLLGALAERLTRSRRLLDELAVGDLDVQRRFDSAYESLSRQEQSIFRLLSILPNPQFTAREAEELLGLDGDTVERALRRFADDHLIRMAYRNGEFSYAFHELTWAYSRERIDAALRDRHVVNGAHPPEACRHE